MIQKQQGFTLLEAIVALVLVATVGMALFNWLNSTLNSLIRVQNAQQRTEAIHNALSFMDTVNPMLTPTGEANIGVYTFQWLATELTPPVDGVNQLGSQGLYKLALYQTNLTILYEQNPLTSLSLRQVGFEQVREPAVLNFEGTGTTF